MAATQSYRETPKPKEAIRDGGNEGQKLRQSSQFQQQVRRSLTTLPKPKKSDDPFVKEEDDDSDYLGDSDAAVETPLSPLNSKQHWQPGGDSVGN